jgi:hypothetical protein
MQGAHAGRRMLARLSIAGSAALLLAFAATRPSPATAAASGTVTMTPPQATPGVGDQVAVTLDVQGAVGVHAVDFVVTYDPAIVQVLDADPTLPGTQILPGAFPGTATQGTVTQDSAGGGQITYRYELTGTQEASGGGTVATILFAAIADGDAGLRWSLAQLIDASGAARDAGGAAAQVSVGAQAVDTATPAATDTATVSATATETPIPTWTSTAEPTSTTQASATVSVSPSATRTAVSPTVTRTPRATATPRITVLQAAGTPTLTVNQTLGVDGAGKKPQNTLPSAGNSGPGVQWWRWTFFGAALMLGAAGWFFTFALHTSDRDAVLVDRRDRLRRRR